MRNVTAQFVGRTSLGIGGIDNVGFSIPRPDKWIKNKYKGAQETGEEAFLIADESQKHMKKVILLGFAILFSGFAAKEAWFPKN